MASLSLSSQLPSAPSDLLTIVLIVANVQVTWKNTAQGYYSYSAQNIAPGQRGWAGGWVLWNLASTHGAAPCQPAPGLTSTCMYPPLLRFHRLAREARALWPKDPLTLVTQFSFKETRTCGRFHLLALTLTLSGE